MTRTVATSSLARCRHSRGLALVGRRNHRLGAIVVDHHDPAAWCLPGARRPVVLTTAAISALDYRQLTAVLAHERAHQKGRHHLLVAMAGAIASAFPLPAAFRTSHEQIARLVELLADDAAAATSPRLAVAEAILALGAPAPAPVTLGAGGPDTAARVRRLLAAPRTLRRPAVLASALTITALTAAPLLLAAGPAVQVIGKPCPPPAKHANARPHRVRVSGIALAPTLAPSASDPLDPMSHADELEVARSARNSGADSW
jgi:bla regulator protein blaR1